MVEKGRRLEMLRDWVLRLRNASVLAWRQRASHLRTVRSLTENSRRPHRRHRLWRASSPRSSRDWVVSQAVV